MLLLRVCSLCLFVLTSCSVVANVDLSLSGRAEVSARLIPQPAFLAYWKDLSDLDSTLPKSPFEVAYLKKSLDSQSSGASAVLTGASVVRQDAETLIRFSVPDSRNALGVPGLIQLQPEGDRTRLVVTLDRKALRSVAGLTSWSKSASLSSLLPAEKAKVSQADYTRLLAYLLEPYDAAAAALVGQSVVELRIKLPSVPTQTEGVTEVQGSTLICRWTVARVLSLETPLTLRALY
jgi:hypothetical protein